MGTYLSQPKTQKESSGGDALRYRWGLSCMQGWRTQMEDSHIAIPCIGAHNLAFFAVFDGHGGSEVASFCAKYLSQELIRRLQRINLESAQDATKGFGEALIGSFNCMDDFLRQPQYQEELSRLKQDRSSLESLKKLIEEGGIPMQKKSEVLYCLQNLIQSQLYAARQRGSLTKDEATQLGMKMTLMKRLQTECAGMDIDHELASADSVGCTGLCILLSSEFVVCANAGDSRAVLCRAGKAIELSRDHKPNDSNERHRIQAAGGTIAEYPVGSQVCYRINGNLNLSRAIGDLEYKKRFDLKPEEQIISSTPDIVREKLQPDDEFIVLACDGVWDVKSNQEVCDFVGSRLRKGQEIPAIIEELLDSCCSSDPAATGGLGCDNMTCIVVELTKPL